jgi:hypothetical protein
MTVATDRQTIALDFDEAKLIVGEDTDLRTGLSALAVDAGQVWLACDEGCRIERLTMRPVEFHADGHTTFDLASLLDLPATPDEEADIEGMDIDDGWLWIVGSHSVKRKKAKPGDTSAKVAQKLSSTGRDGNRHLLARIPLDGGTPKRAAGDRRSGALAATKTSSALLDAIVDAKDPHLGAFVDIPGKDNGLDIEGLAVRGMQLMVGLRGPVLREWCCILELRVEAAPDGGLRLAPLDGPLPYRKHFLRLGGLGVRDLVWLDTDLLVLAGPAMAHDGPVEVWRWKDAASASASGAVDARRVLVVPHGEETDRAEAMALLERAGSHLLMVAFDSPASERLVAPASVKADVFALG